MGVEVKSVVKLGLGVNGGWRLVVVRRGLVWIWWIVD